MSGDWQGLLWAQCWQLAVVIGIVGCVARWSVARWPHAAHVLWLLVLVKCLTLPVWSSPSGVFSRWAWLRTPVWVTTSVGDLGSEREPAPQGSVASVASDSDDAASSESQFGDAASVETATGVGKLGDAEATAWASEASRRDGISGAATRVRGMTIGAAELARPSGASVEEDEAAGAHWSGAMSLAGWRGRWLAGSLGGIWLAGSLAWFGAAMWRWRAFWRRFSQVDWELSARLQPRVTDLAARLGVKRPVRVVVAQAPLGPAVIGIWRPTLVLPSVLMAGWERDGDPDLKKLEPILAHELLHVRRGDLWVGALQTLAQGVWWFHPLVWFAMRRATQTAERCCDEEVVAELGCRPSEYARSLLRVLELKRRLTPIPVFPGVRPVEVTAQRLEAVMRLGQGGRRMARRKASRWTWVLFGLGALAVLPGAGYLTADSPPAASGAAASEASLTKPVGDKPALSASDKPAQVAAEAPAATASEQVDSKLPSEGTRRGGGGLTEAIERLEQAAERGREDRSSGNPTGRLDRRPTDSTPMRVYNLADLLATRRIAHEMSQLAAARDIDDRIGELFVREAEDLRPRWDWDLANDALVLRGTIEQHETLAKALAIWRNVGQPSMVCSVHMYEGTASAFETLPLSWSPYVQERLDAASREAEQTERMVDNPAGRATTGRSGNAVTVSREVLVKVTQFSPDVWSDVETHLRKHRGVKQHYNPSVALAPRTRGQIQMGQIRFLEGVARNADGRLVSRPTETYEGLILGIRPIPHRAGAWNLQLDAKIDQILRVERHAIAGDASDAPAQRDAGDPQPQDRQLVIEVPETMTTRIELEMLATSARPLLAARVPVPTAKQPTREMLVVVRLDDDRTKAPRGVVATENRAVANRTAAAVSPNPAPARIVGRGVNSDAGVTGAVQLAPDAGQLVKAYFVADLVVPLPRVLQADLSQDGGLLKDAPPTASKPSDSDEFRSLIRLIQSTVQPESWADAGGAGRIEANVPTMSLVVRQSAQAHAEITKLLDDLRKMQDVQVVLEVSLLRAPREALASLELGWNDDDQKATQTKKTVWPATSLRKVRELCERDRRATLIQMPKVTAFNGQQVELRVDGEPENAATDLLALDLLPLVSRDHQAVRLSLAFAAVAGAKEMLVANHLGDLREGQALFIRPSRIRQRREQGVPILKDIPYTDRLFRNAGAPQGDLESLLIVYPRTLVLEEEVGDSSRESKSEGAERK